MTDMSEPWRAFAGHYRRYSPPLVPSEKDVAAIKQAIRRRDQNVLLLGVTPALAQLGYRLIAVDRSEDMIARVWAGKEDRTAVRANWSALPFIDGAFSSAIGDGVSTAYDGDIERLLGELRRVTAAQGVVAIRCYCAPPQPESFEAIAEETRRGLVPDPNVLKWRLAMTLSFRDPQHFVLLKDILRTFNALFPDRKDLMRQTGWAAADFSLLDMYRDAPGKYRFLPERDHITICKQSFANAEIFRVSGYPLAELCPTILLS